jgi:2-dehydro-3-deoxyphosphooctonate aldolase (KDO 8-P synthase)
MLKVANISIGSGAPLTLILGLNVLEDETLSLETAAELKRVTKNLNVKFIFKGSFDKANRSSIKSYRGPGVDKGLAILAKVKSTHSLPVITDVHEIDQCEKVAAIADLVQIPAFVCRQTDLVVAAARATEKAGGLLHVKKGQFLAPWDCQNIITKIREAAPSRELTILCERGVSFGYNNLIVDMLAFSEMAKLGVPVTFDATHAVQLPGAGKGNGGENTATGGRREGVGILAAAAVAAGAHGIFLEFHPDPAKAKCDGPSCLPLSEAESLLKKLIAISVVR